MKQRLHSLGTWVRRSFCYEGMVRAGMAWPLALSSHFLGALVDSRLDTDPNLAHARHEVRPN